MKNKKFMKKELVKNKVIGVLTLIIGIVSIYILDGDGTAFMLLSFISLCLFCAKKNYIN